VENRIKEQQGKLWNRDLFENHLMGYTLRSNRYRLVAWLDYRDVNSKPLYLELYDHKKDPEETHNIAGELPGKVNELLKKLRMSGIGKRE
jgi:iduronate 2-sulfatase